MKEWGRDHPIIAEVSIDVYSSAMEVVLAVSTLRTVAQ